MMEAIGHYDPAHLAERIELRAYVVGGCAGAMNPEGITRESNDGRPRSQANTTEPYRTLGDPDVRHDDFENVGRHAVSMGLSGPRINLERCRNASRRVGLTEDNPYLNRKTPRRSSVAAMGEPPFLIDTARN